MLWTAEEGEGEEGEEEGGGRARALESDLDGWTCVACVGGGGKKGRGRGKKWEGGREGGTEEKERRVGGEEMGKAWGVKE